MLILVKIFLTLFLLVAILGGLLYYITDKGNKSG